MKKLAIGMPSADLVEGYLTEIARGYGVQWKSDPRPVGDGEHGDAQDLVVSDPSIPCEFTYSLILTRTGLQRLQKT
jgi:vacuolar protein sorting-associated protein IST1